MAELMLQAELKGLPLFGKHLNTLYLIDAQCKVSGLHCHLKHMQQPGQQQQQCNKYHHQSVLK